MKIRLMCPDCGSTWVFEFGWKGFYFYTGSKLFCGHSPLCGQCTVFHNAMYKLRWDYE